MRTCPVFLPDATLCNQPVFHRGLCEVHARYLKPRQGLGFNLIVKNESNCLERTLTNIRPIADEIIITDTGSSDNTVEIALSHADLVLFNLWEDSFSEARNWGLQYATAKWQCWIDADETLANPDDLKASIAQHPNAMTFLCEMLSEMPDGRVAKHYLPKVFRRGTAHFEGRVHNQLIHKNPIIATAVKFWHSGYNESAEIMAKKRERTIGLLRKQLDKDPDNTFAMMNLARTLRNHGETEEATEIADRGLALETEPTAIRQMLLYSKILACMDEGDDRVHDLLEKALSLNPHNVDFLYLKAFVSLKEGWWVDALLALTAYRVEKERQTTAHYDNLLTDFWDLGSLEYEMLATAYLNIGQYHDARDALRSAIAINPNDARYWNDYVKCCIEMGDMDAADAAESEARGRGVL